jgi:hypothetical protein
MVDNFNLSCQQILERRAYKGNLRENMYFKDSPNQSLRWGFGSMGFIRGMLFGENL